jgi:hypothetical protein
MAAAGEGDRRPRLEPPAIDHSRNAGFLHERHSEDAPNNQQQRNTKNVREGHKAILGWTSRVLNIE